MSEHTASRAPGPHPPQALRLWHLPLRELIVSTKRGPTSPCSVSHNSAQGCQHGWVFKDAVGHLLRGLGGQLACAEARGHDLVPCSPAAKGAPARPREDGSLGPRSRKGEPQGFEPGHEELSIYSTFFPVNFIFPLIHVLYVAVRTN